MKKQKIKEEENALKQEEHKKIMES